MKTKHLQKCQSNGISLRTQFEHKSHYQPYPLKVTGSVYRFLNGKLYHNSDDNWMVFSPNSPVPELIKMPDDYSSYLAKKQEIVFYKTEDNHLVHYDLVADKELKRIPIPVKNISQIDAGSFFYGSDDKQNYSIYDKNLRLLGKLRLPAHKKYFQYKGQTTTNLVFASFPERCYCSYIHKFNFETKKWKEFQADAWFGSSSGEIDSKSITFHDLDDIFILNLETAKLNHFADYESVNRWRKIKGTLFFIDKTTLEIKSLYLSNNFQKVPEHLTKISPTLELIPFGIENYYFRETLNSGGTQIEFFNLITKKWRYLTFPERLIKAETQQDKRFEYLVMTFEKVKRVLVVEPRSQKIVEQYEFPFCLDVKHVSFPSKNQTIIFGENRPGYSQLTKKTDKINVSNSLNPGYVIKQRGLLRNNLIVLTKTTAFVFQENLCSIESVTLPQINTKNEVEMSPSVLGLTSDCSVALVAQRETKTIKSPRGFLDRNQFRIHYHLIGTGKKQVLFSYSSNFSENNIAKGVIQGNLDAYVYADGYLLRMDIFDCSIQKIDSIPSPNFILKTQNFVICGKYNEPPKTVLNPHILVFDKNGRKTKRNFGNYNLIYTHNNAFYYSYYSSEKKQSFWGKMIITESNNSLKIEKECEREGSSPSIANVTGDIIWVKKGYNPSIIKFHHEKKAKDLGYLYLFSDNNMVITLFDEKYFYASDISKLAFINKQHKQVKPDPIYLNIYNNLRKTLQHIGLEESHTDFFRELEKLANQASSKGPKALPSNF